MLTVVGCLVEAHDLRLVVAGGGHLRDCRR